MSDSYAIVKAGGKQYRAQKGAELVVDRLPDDEGAKVTLPAVMYRDGDNVVMDGADLDKVKVEAVVAEHLRGPKVRIFKHRPKKGYRRRAGHRSELTRLEVREVKLLQRRPAGAKAEESDEKAEAKPKTDAKPKAKAQAKPKSEAKPRKPATKKTPAKKKDED